MNRRPLEPLDAEERALADQLGRLGPHGEPSSKLDARILAAAHDAVAAQPPVARRRPRWPMGFGVAASVMVAVAIAWQLRPMHEAPQVALEENADLPVAAADVAQPAQPPVGPPVVRFESRPPPPPAMAKVENPPEREMADAAASAARKPAGVQHRTRPTLAEHAARAPQTAAVASTTTTSEDIPEGLPLRASEAATPQRYDVDYAAVPAPPVVLAAPGTVSAARDDSDQFGYVADPETTAAIALRREQARAEHARNAAEAAEKGELRTRASQTSAAMQDALPSVASTGGITSGRAAGNAAPASKRAPTQAGALPAGATRNGLKRTDLQLPVAEDTKLEADAWLERIRLRRDLGDRSSATDSLLRFKQQHPFQKVPEDLKELLGE